MLNKATKLSSEALVSIFVLLAFTITAVLAFTKAVPSSNQFVQYVLTTFGTLATTVVSYWVGSSSGSARKTDLLAGINTQTTSASAETMPPLSGPKP